MSDFLHRLNQARVEREVARRSAQVAAQQLKSEQAAQRASEEQQARSRQELRLAMYNGILEAIDVHRMMTDFKTYLGREGRPELIRVQGEFIKRTDSGLYDDVGSVESTYLMLGYAITQHLSKHGSNAYFAGIVEIAYVAKIVVAYGSASADDHWVSRSLINDALADCAAVGCSGGATPPDATDVMQVARTRAFMESKLIDG